MGKNMTYDELVEKVTAETLTSENWALMMHINDDVSAKGQKACKHCLTSIKKRLNHRDSHVSLLALSLLDCLWNNCSALFRREVSSKEFISELHYKATSSNRIIGEKTRELIKKWSTNECQKDSSLSLVESLYRDLLDDGWTFESSANSKKTLDPLSNDPNVVSSAEEEADIAKAIALSLNEANDRGKRSSSVLYPSSSNNSSLSHVNSTNGTSQRQANERQVKALYDFEAVEDNEISFAAGELIVLLDDSDQNWWRGSTARATGLFPASFVTHDLEANVIDDKLNVNGKDAAPQQQVEQPEIPKVEINEDILLKCFQLLQDCDPTGEVPDSPELAYYEQMSLAQAALIDQKLAQIDKQHNMLAQTDVAIRDVLANYDSAVQQVNYQMQNAYASSSTMVGSVATSIPPAPGPMAQSTIVSATSGGHSAALSAYSTTHLFTANSTSSAIPATGQQPTTALHTVNATGRQLLPPAAGDLPSVQPMPVSSAQAFGGHPTVPY